MNQQDLERLCGSDCIGSSCHSQVKWAHWGRCVSILATPLSAAILGGPGTKFMIFPLFQQRTSGWTPCFSSALQHLAGRACQCIWSASRTHQIYECACAAGCHLLWLAACIAPVACPSLAHTHHAWRCPAYKVRVRTSCSLAPVFGSKTCGTQESNGTHLHRHPHKKNGTACNQARRLHASMIAATGPFCWFYVCINPVAIMQPSCLVHFLLALLPWQWGCIHAPRCLNCTHYHQYFCSAR